MLTDDQKRYIVNKLERTCNSGAMLADELELELSDIEEIMLDYNYERCPECGWWCECCELVDDDGGASPCRSCRRYSADDSE